MISMPLLKMLEPVIDTEVPTNGNTGGMMSYTDLNFIAYGLILPLVISAGIFGNITNLIVLMQSKLPMSKVTLFYFRALSTVNLLVMFSAISPSIFQANTGKPRSYTTAFMHAHISLFFINLFIGLSVYILVIITLDRFVSICFPLKSYKFHTIRMARCMILTGLLISIVCNAHLVFSFEVVPFFKQTPTMSGPCYFGVASCDMFYDVAVNEQVRMTSVWKFMKWNDVAILRVIPIVLVIALSAVTLFRFRYAVDNDSSTLDTETSSHSNSTESSICETPIEEEYQPNCNCEIPSSTLSRHNQVRLSIKPDEQKGAVKSLVEQLHVKVIMAYKSREPRDRISTSTSVSTKSVFDGCIFKAVCGVSCLFVFCVTPGAILVMIDCDMQTKRGVLYQSFRALSNILEVSNSAFNFYVMCMCSREVRVALRRTISSAFQNLG